MGHSEVDVDFAVYYRFAKSEFHNPDTPMYMEALSRENSEGYFKAMNDEIKSLTRRDTWEIVSKK